MMGVSYADYKVGFWYLDPELLFLEDGSCLMGPLYKDDQDGKSGIKEDETNSGSLFDEFQ